MIGNHQISRGLPEITWSDKFQINHVTIMLIWNYENCWVFSKRLDTNTLAVLFSTDLLQLNKQNDIGWCL